MQSDRLFDRHVLGRPAVHGHEAGLAGDDAAARHGQEMRDAIGARDGNQFGIGVDRDPGLDIGRVFADLAGVARGADGVDFDEAERSGSRDESGIKVLAVELRYSVCLGFDDFLDGGDFAVLDQDLPRRKRRAGHRVDGRAGQ